MSETPIGDQAISDIRLLVDNAERIGRLKEQMEIIDYLKEATATAPKSALPAYKKLIDWIEAR